MAEGLRAANSVAVSPPVMATAKATRSMITVVVTVPYADSAVMTCLVILALGLAWLTTNRKGLALALTMVIVSATCCKYFYIFRFLSYYVAMELRDFIRRSDIKALADYAGVSVGYIYMLTSKCRRPSYKLALAIEKFSKGAISRSELRSDIYSPPYEYPANINNSNRKHINEQSRYNSLRSSPDVRVA